MHQLVTTLLDLVGLLLAVVAVGVAVWPASPAAALGVCGVLLLAVSWLVDRRQGAQR